MAPEATPATSFKQLAAIQRHRTGGASLPGHAAKSGRKVGSSGTEITRALREILGEQVIMNLADGKTKIKVSKAEALARKVIGVALSSQDHALVLKAAGFIIERTEGPAEAVIARLGNSDVATLVRVPAGGYSDLGSESGTQAPGSAPGDDEDDDSGKDQDDLPQPELDSVSMADAARPDPVPEKVSDKKGNDDGRSGQKRKPRKRG